MILDLDLDLDLMILDLDLDLRPDPRLVLRPTSRILRLIIYRFRGTLTGIN